MNPTSRPLFVGDGLGTMARLPFTEQLASFMIMHSAGRPVILAGDAKLHADRVHPDSGTSGGIDDTAVWNGFLAATGSTDTCAELSCPDWASIDKAAYRDGPGVGASVAVPAIGAILGGPAAVYVVRDRTQLPPDPAASV